MLRGGFQKKDLVDALARIDACAWSGTDIQAPMARLSKHVFAALEEGKSERHVRDDGPSASPPLKASPALPWALSASGLSRGVSNRLLLMALEGGTARRDASVVHCACNVWGMHHAPPAAAARTEGPMGHLIRRSVRVLIDDNVVADVSRVTKRNGHWHVAARLIQHHLGSDNPSGPGDETRLPASTGGGRLTGTSIDVFAAAREWQLALRLLQEMPRHQWQETEVSALLKAMANAAKTPRPKQHQDQHPHEHQSGALWSSALGILASMNRSGGTITAASTVNHALAILARAQRHHECVAVLERYFALPPPPPSLAADTYDSVQEKATDTTPGDVRTRSALPTTATTLSYVCLAFRQRWSHALSYASAIIAQDPTRPGCIDGIAISQLIGLCSSAGRWVEACAALGLATAHGCELNGTTYTSVALAVGAAGQCAAARAIAKSTSANLSPAARARTLNLLAQQSRTAADMQQYLAEDPALVPEDATSRALVVALANEGQWVEAMRHLEPLICSGRCTAACHAAVQYALLEKASGAAWREGLQCYALAAQHQVPISEVAFRCCIRLCFAAGQTSAAQAMLQTVMTQGMGRPQ